jgi:hypothetical protein
MKCSWAVSHMRHLCDNTSTSQLQTKCQQSHSILCTLTGAFWWAGRMTVYCCLVCAWLNYRFFIYASASKRILSLLNSLHITAICLYTGPLQQSEWRLCVQNQGNLHFVLADKFYYTVMPQCWEISRSTHPTKQYTSALSSEGLPSICRQATQQMLDSRSFWVHFICLHLPSSLFETVTTPPWAAVSPHCDTGLCNFPKAYAPPDTV